jgi:hypothetical protein
MINKYLKDNPNRFWFKAKTYGWGWTPESWQGWVVTLIYTTLIVIIIFTKEEPVAGNPNSGSNFLTFALPIIVLTSSLIFICYKKGEKPRWRWGAKK